MSRRPAPRGAHGAASPAAGLPRVRQSRLRAAPGPGHHRRVCEGEGGFGVRNFARPLRRMARPAAAATRAC